MGVRQYIGARYVPKFMGTFDNTQQYEALCVVDNGLGTSYISTKTVPPGSSLTDTTYWALYGAASGAVLNLQNQIDAIHGIIATPEMYEAVGDGSADDTIPLQNALNASDIVICLGSYKITSQITVPDGVQIIGPGSIIVDDSLTQFDAIDLKGNNVVRNIAFTETYAILRNTDSIIYAKDVSNITVEDCSFDTISAGYCIFIESSNNLRINHNTINHYSFSGIMLINGCKYGEIEYNYIYDGRDTSTSNRYGISISGYFTVADEPAEFIKCNYNYIEDVTPYWEGIDSHSCENCEMIGNRIINTSNGIVFASPTVPTLASGNTAKNLIIKDNYIKVASNAGNTASGITFTVGAHGRGIIENVEVSGNEIDISGNTLYHSSAVSGIALRSESHNAKIEHNIVKNSAPGIYLEGPATDVSISYNDISGGLTGNDYGINLDGVTGVHNLVVAFNYIHNVVRSFRGPAVAVSELAIYSNNNDNNSFASVDYTTVPRTAISATTKALGKSGDFVPCSDSSGSVVGWFCIAAGTWKAVSGS